MPTTRRAAQWEAIRNDSDEVVRVAGRASRETPTEGILSLALKTTLQQRETALNRLHPLPQERIAANLGRVLFPGNCNFRKGEVGPFGHHGVTLIINQTWRNKSAK